jgi:hypothetical protein
MEEESEITDQDIEGLKKYAVFRSAFRVPTASKIASIVFGIIALLLGFGSISANALNIILVLIGGALLIEGVWLIIAPIYYGLLIDGILIAVIGVWNVVTTLLNSKVTGSVGTPLLAYGIFQLAWGITTIIRFINNEKSIVTFNRLESKNYEKIADSLYALSPKEYSDMFAFKARKTWKGMFNDNAVICMSDGQDIYVTQREKFCFIINGKKSGNGRNKAIMLIDRQRFKGTVDDSSLENYEAWISEDKSAETT